MYKLVIVGAGNIGSRHLQAFGDMEEAADISVVDPSEEALKICRDRWAESKKPKCGVNVQLSSKLAVGPEAIDLAIISTNSEHRLSVLASVLARVPCKNVLLEKFLFSKKEEFAAAEQLLRNHSVAGYVNVVRRTFEAYQWLRGKLGLSVFSMKVAGNDWGMCSNSIHFLDLFCYLADDKLRTCEFVGSCEILESKRAGYLELLGELHAKTEKGCELIIKCSAGAYERISMTIGTENPVHIEEKGSTITITGQALGTKNFEYPYQSQLTARHFQEMMDGRASLPSYAESAFMHLKFLEAVQALLTKQNYQKEWKIT